MAKGRGWHGERGRHRQAAIKGRAGRMRPNQPIMEPWTSEDYVLEEARRQARELRASGEYEKVEVRRRRSEGGRQYARVYVSVVDRHGTPYETEEEYFRMDSVARKELQRRRQEERNG